jgi:hypothetical protein
MLFVLAPACGGGSSSGSGTANIRFVQGSIDAPSVDFLVNGTTETSNMLYGNASGYISAKSGSIHVQVIPVNSTTPLLDQTLSLAENANETLILTGPVAQKKSLVLNDGSTTTGGTTTTLSVRVVNISTQMGPADVYIVRSGTNISGATPVAKSLGFDQDTGYQATTVGTGSAGGNYTVYMTVPNTQSVYISTGPLNFSGASSTSSSGKQTVIILDNPSNNGFTFTGMSDQ